MKLEHSPFDSENYGLRIGQLRAEPGDSERELDEAMQLAQDQCDVCFFRLDEREPLVRLLERRGAAPVDRLVTSALGPGRLKSAIPTGIAITCSDRLAGKDVERASALMVAAMNRSHLHADPRLPAEATRRLFAAWTRNDVTGRARVSIVAREGAAFVGLITILVRGERAILDLVAVGDRVRGRGVGSAMLASAVAWIDERRLAATVGTQSDNPALRLYARHGFEPHMTEVTFHLWSR